MLYLPMESERENGLGRVGSHLRCPRQIFLAFDLALSFVPYVAGVNNHMGSLLTRDPTAFVS